MTSDLDDKSVVVGERNKVVIQTLQRAIDEGHNKIGVTFMPRSEKKKVRKIVHLYVEIKN